MIKYIKRNDLQPYMYIQALHSTGTAVDLSGCVIRATMTNQEDGTTKINHTSTGVTITSVSNGEFEYQWQSGDTNTTGVYLFEFEITPGTGGKFTLPADRSLKVVIEPDGDAS